MGYISKKVAAYGQFVLVFLTVGSGSAGSTHKERIFLPGFRQGRIRIQIMAISLLKTSISLGSDKMTCNCTVCPRSSDPFYIITY